ncbi:hypothetical protein Zm00014a_029866 [Zea mays]|uniref:Uncharacterized protein n=1 Tax=Zea mays TaxID=4577 RepID=A0A3L6FDK2_MAIZE|nr:hypothetical protein Zm00014a_029866 [Zea mays]
MARRRGAVRRGRPAAPPPRRDRRFRVRHLPRVPQPQQARPCVRHRHLLSCRRVFACCFAKLQQLRRDPAATEAEMRRVRIAAWVVSTALGIAATLRVADAVHGLALKLVVWAVSIVLHGIGFYFLFLRKGANAARQPASALPGGLSPEEKV